MVCARERTLCIGLLTTEVGLLSTSKAIYSRNRSFQYSLLAADANTQAHQMEVIHPLLPNDATAYTRKDKCGGGCIVAAIQPCGKKTG